MVFVDQVPVAHRLCALWAVGDVFPPHCNANGKAALAALSEVGYWAALRSKHSDFAHKSYAIET
ncbi:MAG: hypothetical protein KGO94_13020 [Alphaproteobacteria bacterium]|nr:hypothetical protein [Alphaproteobacteria bacterium]